ncbi:MAG: hypothetical protein ABFD44_03470, partial [Anaerolineaceae bacterium]
KVSSTVPLGWTRVVIRRAAELISQIADAPAEDVAATPGLEIDQTDFTDQISKSLEDLWRM